MKPLHISLNTAHSGCRLSSSVSSFTHSLQVFLPDHLHISIGPINSTLTVHMPPNHPNLPCLTPSATLWTSKRLYKTSLHFLSFRDTPHIHLTIIRSSSLCIVKFVIVMHRHRHASSSSSFIFKKSIVQLGLDVPPEMKPLHISLNTAHSACKPSAFISLFTHSYQVFLPLHAHLTPATTTFLQADTQSSSLLCSTCPNHPNLPHLTTSATLSTPKRLYLQIHTAFPILQRHSAHPSHHHLYPSSHTKCVAQIAELGNKFQLHMELNHNFFQQNWLKEAILTLQAPPTMEINITLQLSWNATTSFLDPPITLHTKDWVVANSLPTNTTWMLSRILSLTHAQPTPHDFCLSSIHFQTLLFHPLLGLWKINKNVYKIIIFDLEINIINVKAISKQRIKHI